MKLNGIWKTGGFAFLFKIEKWNKDEDPYELRLFILWWELNFSVNKKAVKSDIFIKICILVFLILFVLKIIGIIYLGYQIIFLPIVILVIIILWEAGKIMF